MTARIAPVMADEPLLLPFADGVARVTLARPDVRNAFNADVIARTARHLHALAGDDDVRAVVLAGEGKVFCGGADINWMRESLDLSFDANVADAERMSDMFRAIDRCRKPVIARIHGAALGGGAGLAAVCDIAIATDDAVFGFTEVKLGIIPAVISPFVLAKIGASHARALFLTGERFDAARAQRIGLVHEVVAAADLDAAVERVLGEIRTAGPYAVSRGESADPPRARRRPTTSRARLRRARSPSSASARKAKRACARFSNAARPNFHAVIRRLLIANRGEIAVRVARAAREMGIAPLGIYSEADESAYHLQFMDDARCVGPAPAAESYLDIDAVIAAGVSDERRRGASGVRLSFRARGVRASGRAMRG